MSEGDFVHRNTLPPLVRELTRREVGLLCFGLELAAEDAETYGEDAEHAETMELMELIQRHSRLLVVPEVNTFEVKG